MSSTRADRCGPPEPHCGGRKFRLPSRAHHLTFSKLARGQRGYHRATSSVTRLPEGDRMLRAVFVRTLKPGVTDEEFIQAWMPEGLDTSSYPSAVSVSHSLTEERRIISIFE